jgi:Glycoside hydrolase 97.
MKVINIKSIIILSLLSLMYGSADAQKKYTLSSPDRNVNVEIHIGEKIEYSISKKGIVLLDKSPLSIILNDGTVWGKDAKLKKAKKNTVNEYIESPVYKRNRVHNHYNEIDFEFRGQYNILFRVYNEGVAYRFASTRNKPFIVKNEEAIFNLPDDYLTHVSFVRTATYHKDNLFEPGSFEDQFFKSFVNTYSHLKLSEWDKSRLSLPPLVIEGAGGYRLCITEADLLNYPGMYLYNPTGENRMQGMFAAYPEEVKQGGFANIQEVVTRRADYIATYETGTTFPWRIVCIADSDYELADNDMVYRLATPNRIEDMTWIKPGKAAWDWWNDRNISGVDFRAGINNDTYKYYIDFASENDLEYILIDEGWAASGNSDLFRTIPEIDLKELVEYGKKKNVGLILWAGYYVFNRDMEALCRYYSEMGIKGFKVDFMDRDDQQMVDFHHRAARTTAKYKLLINYHGTYKPTGLQRTYPNAITFEAVQGLEHMKWAAPSVDQVTHDVTIPFIRMVAGPLDYTPGAMKNATKKEYRPGKSEPMSQGTRCRQLAQYIVFESPLTMLSDSPTNYMKEQECTDFIAKIPVTWDNTIALNGEIAKYISIARRKGDEWYVAGMTNPDARTLNLDLSFLSEGNYEAELFRDGTNADRIATDYKREIISIPTNKKLDLPMAPGGGYAMRIYKK